MKHTTTEPCFSNGTEFMQWQDINCLKCKKAVWYNEKLDRYPQYRCAVQRDIERQAAGLEKISKRSYNATKPGVCLFFRPSQGLTKKNRFMKAGVTTYVDLFDAADASGETGKKGGRE